MKKLLITLSIVATAILGAAATADAGHTVKYICGYDSCGRPIYAYRSVPTYNPCYSQGYSHGRSYYTPRHSYGHSSSHSYGHSYGHSYSRPSYSTRSYRGSSRYCR